MTYDEKVLTAPKVCGAQVSSNTGSFYHPLSGKYGCAASPCLGGDVPIALCGSKNFVFAGGQPSIPLSVNGMTPISADAAATTSAFYTPGSTASTGITYFGPSPVLAGSPATISPAPSQQNVLAVFQANGTVEIYTSTTSTFDTATPPLETLTPSAQASGMVIFVNGGDLYVQQATGATTSVLGQVTLAAQSGTTSSGEVDGNIIIGSNVVYNGKTVGTNSYGGTASLGLVAQNNVLVQPNASITEIDGALMAVNGGIAVNTQGSNPDWTIFDGNYNTPRTGEIYGLPTFGNLTFFGSSSNQQYYPKGAKNPITGVQTGYLPNFVHDPRFSTAPPPAFPSTGSCTVVVLVDEGALH